ncbi:MAG: hypothetical protein VZS44_05470 [Bacilli bacterium]|nr:hypothetical protein [Bacilli bacterium]
MVDIYIINEKLNKLLEEGDIKIPETFKKSIIQCIYYSNIHEENLEQVIERILDNSYINKNGINKYPKTKTINRIINSYIKETNYKEDELYTTNEYIDNNINEQIYNGYYKKNKIQAIIFKPKTKELKKD